MEQQRTTPPVDLTEGADAYTVRAELPGFTPEQVDIKIEGNVLHLRGEYQSEDKKEDGQVHLRERRAGSFERSLVLPTGVDADKAEANFENGVLTLTLPKREDARAKRITITPKKQIEAQNKK